MWKSLRYFSTLGVFGTSRKSSVASVSSKKGFVSGSRTEASTNPSKGKRTSAPLPTLKSSTATIETWSELPSPQELYSTHVDARTASFKSSVAAASRSAPKKSASDKILSAESSTTPRTETLGSYARRKHGSIASDRPEMPSFSSSASPRAINAPPSQTGMRSEVASALSSLARRNTAASPASPTSVQSSSSSSSSSSPGTFQDRLSSVQPSYRAHANLASQGTVQTILGFALSAWDSVGKAKNALPTAGRGGGRGGGIYPDDSKQLSEAQAQPVQDTAGQLLFGALALARVAALWKPHRSKDVEALRGDAFALLTDRCSRLISMGLREEEEEGVRKTRGGGGGSATSVRAKSQSPSSSSPPSSSLLPSSASQSRTLHVTARDPRVLSSMMHALAKLSPVVRAPILFNECLNALSLQLRGIAAKEGTGTARGASSFQGSLESGGGARGASNFQGSLESGGGGDETVYPPPRSIAMLAWSASRYGYKVHTASITSQSAASGEMTSMGYDALYDLIDASVRGCQLVHLEKLRRTIAAEQRRRAVSEQQKRRDLGGNSSSKQQQQHLLSASSSLKRGGIGELLSHDSLLPAAFDATECGLLLSAYATAGVSNRVLYGTLVEMLIPQLPLATQTDMTTICAAASKGIALTASRLPSSSSSIEKEEADMDASFAASSGRSIDGAAALREAEAKEVEGGEAKDGEDSSASSLHSLLVHVGQEVAIRIRRQLLRFQEKQQRLAPSSSAEAGTEDSEDGEVMQKRKTSDSSLESNSQQQQQQQQEHASLSSRSIALCLHALAANGIKSEGAFGAAAEYFSGISVSSGTDSGGLRGYRSLGSHPDDVKRRMGMSSGTLQAASLRLSADLTAPGGTTHQSAPNGAPASSRFLQDGDAANDGPGTLISAAFADDEGDVAVISACDSATLASIAWSFAKIRFSGGGDAQATFSTSKMWSAVVATSLARINIAAVRIREAGQNNTEGGGGADTVASSTNSSAAERRSRMAQGTHLSAAQGSSAANDDGDGDAEDAFASSNSSPRASLDVMNSESAATPFSSRPAPFSTLELIRPSQIAAILWATTRLSFSSPALAQAALRHIKEAGAHSYSVPSLAQVLWGASLQGVITPSTTYTRAFQHIIDVAALQQRAAAAQVGGKGQPDALAAQLLPAPSGVEEVGRITGRIPSSSTSAPSQPSPSRRVASQLYAAYLASHILPLHAAAKESQRQGAAVASSSTTGELLRQPAPPPPTYKLPEAIEAHWRKAHAGSEPRVSRLQDSVLRVLRTAGGLRDAMSEYTTPEGLLVDVFIPPRTIGSGSVAAPLQQQHRGFIIEVQGPQHFVTGLAGHATSPSYGHASLLSTPTTSISPSDLLLRQDKLHQSKMEVTTAANAVVPLYASSASLSSSSAFPLVATLASRAKVSWLQALGYKVVCIHWKDWAAYPSTEERLELLHEHGVPVSLG